VTRSSPDTLPVCRVVIADDHALFRQGVATVINQEAGLEVVAEAADGAEAVRLYETHRPDVMLLDLRMPRLDGLEAVIRIREQDADARLIILTTYDTDEDIERALRAGAKAYLLKDASAEELVQCIRDVCAGHTRVAPAVAAKLAQRFTQVQLTVREYAVLRLLALGSSNRDIARELFISEGTVKVHITHLFEKLGVANRTEAITVAVRRGLVRLD
jgi:two-component system NarL family response regulator